MKKTIMTDDSSLKLLGKKQKKSKDIMTVKEKTKSLLEFFNYNQTQKQVYQPINKQKRCFAQKDEHYSLVSKYSLIRNPSVIQSKNAQIIIDDRIDIKQIQLFSEVIIKNLIPLFSTINHNFNKAFCILKQELPISYNDDDYGEFTNENLLSILIKFFLQLNNNTIFIPQDYLETNKVDSSKISFISGINTVKSISLQYNSMNSIEVKNENYYLFETITKYLKLFYLKKTKNNTQKALVLFNEDYFAFTNQIEIISKDQEFKILRIDELENHKLNKFHKISEATQSQRIACIPEIINEKLKIIEALLSSPLNHTWNKLVNQVNDEENNLKIKFFENKLIDNNLNNENNSKNSKEKKAYNLFENNIFQTCCKNKTLLLLIEPFSNEEDAKIYLNSIISQIPQSKCPIIILTNNLKPFKSLNVSNHFLFTQIQTNSPISRKYYLFLLAFVLFLHLAFDNSFNNNNLGFEEIIYDIKQKLNKESFFIELTQFNIYNRIVKLVMFILCESKDNLDKSQMLLFSALKRVENIKKIKEKIDQIEKSLLIEEEIVNINQTIDNVKTIVNWSEEISLNNLEEGKLNNLIGKQFNQLTKNNHGDIVNCENHIINQLFYDLMNVKKNKEEIFSKTLLMKRRNFDKKYFNYYFSLNHLFVSNQNYHDYNYFLLYVDQLEITKLYQLFNLRLPRRLDITSNSKLNQNERMKQNVLNKFMKSCNIEQFNRFIKAHKQNEICYSLFTHYFINHETLNYFTDYRQINELSKINHIIMIDKINESYKLKNDSDSFVNGEDSLEESE